MGYALDATGAFDCRPGERPRRRCYLRRPGNLAGGGAFRARRAFFRLLFRPRMLRSACFLGSLLLLAACTGVSSDDRAATGPPHLAPGPWHGSLTVVGRHRLPFELEVLPDSAGRTRAVLRNGGESFRLTDFATIAGDSLKIGLHVFDAALVGRVSEEGFAGYWQKYDGKAPFRVPFTLRPGRAGKLEAEQAVDFGGTWAVTFTDSDGQLYPAVGEFKQRDNLLSGTFLTTTGDYRYLRGTARKDSVTLYTFDGAHGYVFEAIRQADGSLKGDFWSGQSGHETWVARRDPKARLPDADALTGMKTGETRLDFKFPNIYEGGAISPTDPKYAGKVVVLQILGSWCPNCLDETNFLAPWYRKNRKRGVEIIGLGFERGTDQAAGAAKLRRLRERLGMDYDVAIAGSASAAEASKALPQLREVLAFPTTIFLGRDGTVRKVHTGFSGPGTGKYYDEWKKDFEATITELLAEK